MRVLVVQLVHQEDGGSDGQSGVMPRRYLLFRGSVMQLFRSFVAEDTTAFMATKECGCEESGVAGL